MIGAESRHEDVSFTAGRRVIGSKVLKINVIFNMFNANTCFYADDTMTYSSGSTGKNLPLVYKICPCIHPSTNPPIRPSLHPSIHPLPIPVFTFKLMKPWLTVLTLLPTWNPSKHSFNRLSLRQTSCPLIIQPFIHRNINPTSRKPFSSPQR